MLFTDLKAKYAALIFISLAILVVFAAPTMTVFQLYNTLDETAAGYRGMEYRSSSVNSNVHVALEKRSLVNTGEVDCISIAPAATFPEACIPGEAPEQDNVPVEKLWFPRPRPSRPPCRCPYLCPAPCPCEPPYPCPFSWRHHWHCGVAFGRRD